MSSNQLRQVCVKENYKYYFFLFIRFVNEWNMVELPVLLGTQKAQ